MKSPIGVFDSGVGGLTVLKELMRVLPHEHFVYFGDTARVPYGGKSAETITRYSMEIANYLIRGCDIKLLVAACNTVSSQALSTMRKIYRIPVVGMVEPCVRRVAALRRKSYIGVIGTLGTIRSGAYEKALLAAVPSAKIRAISCPLFAPLVEEGWTDHDVTRAVIAEYLSPFRSKPPDALILGCTHYPVLKKAIKEFIGEKTVLIDSGEEAAAVVDIILSEKMARSKRRRQMTRFLATDDPEGFGRVGKCFFGRELKGVQLATL